MSKSQLLEIKNLNINFNTKRQSVTAVKDISFEINHAEIVAIVGESGSGKSVAALSIMRLLNTPPANITADHIKFQLSEDKTIDLCTLTEKEMTSIRGKEISMIFQEPMTSLNPVMKCGKQIEEALLIHKILPKNHVKAKVLDLLSSVGIKEPERIYASYPHQLSGGQKQRVMIAMAMSCNPKLLIADEPTTALDVTVQKKILLLLKELRDKTQMSILFISHDLGIVAEFADKVVVMYKGEIVESGPVSEIFNNPQHPYTKALLFCRPPLNVRLKLLPTLQDFMDADEKDSLKEKYFTDKNILKQKDLEQSLKLLYEQNPVIEVKELTTSFSQSSSSFWKKPKKMLAVSDVSFNLYKGEVLGLVGESGSGKSTLARTITKLVKSSEGNILYHGNDILKYSEKEFRPLRKDIQIIFQDPYASLNPRMRIGEAIVEPMIVHGLHKNKYFRKDKAMELLKNVGLNEDAFYKYPHEFSGGQRQRVSIARALSVEPKILICDECVSALDVNVQAQVLNLLVKLKEEFNLSYLFITHDLSVVRFISDRIMVMRQGRIEEIGMAEQVFNNPHSLYTKELLEAVPKVDFDKWI